ncbi:hypothetical protein [Paenibacillus sp. DYY-L-2]|uniref:hypothetical protein n=1 Tax=Paenibacillus sp. DYY-L-2 TaxID=3447013 RepID=UPI003F4F5A19
MKRLFYSLLLIFGFIGLSFTNPTSTQAASQFTGGLMDGVQLQVGTTIGQPTTTGITEMTDGNVSTRGLLNNPNVMAWHTFTSPVDISSVVVKSSGTSYVEFYDLNNNLLLKYDLLSNDGIQTLPAPVKGVSTVVLKTTTSGGIWVYEWNVFTTPSAPPTATTITWIQGGDKIVTFDWNHSGAASYNVKRSTSSLGPYVTIANVKGTSYIDTAVTNGTTYYYVVSAVNEAGESSNSPEKSMKPQATKYTGGLLDGLALKVGSSITNPTSTVREMTDSNESTRGLLNNPNVMTWHTFASPTDISSVIVKSSGASYVEFYDSNNNLLLKYDLLSNDGIQTLPSPVKDVSTVVLKTTTSGGIWVYEWNVFATSSAPPMATTISWIQGGDQIVKFDWVNTGAASYNVKRSTSSLGPYALIANVKGTAYVDRAVTNGTTYYYVVSAVNEAGESSNSPEKSMKPQATKYTGGLLDGLELKIGSSVANPTSSVRELTDNNESTRGLLNNTSVMSWYTFASPVEVSAVILKSSGTSFVEFYDSNNNLLLKYDVTNTGELQTLPTPVKDVTTVVLKTGATGGMWVYEWNVFGKGGELPTETPMNLTATAGNKKVVLNWTSNGGNVTSFVVKRALVAGGPYTTIDTVTGNTYTYTDTNVLNATTYYYVVSAVGAAGESGNSNEAFATPKADVVNPPLPGENETGERALLRITLNNGIEKEYDLSMAEVNAFINWYEGRANGTGTVMYAINKHDNNKGPFKNRKDYVFYDKIITFEVNGYDSGTGEPEENEEIPVPNPEAH